MSTTDWTEGYVADVGYTFGYYGELNPLRSHWAFLNAGLVPPLLPAGGAACELGFGQGVSVAVHAAASRTEWWGTDFNPSQAGHAQELARASGTKAHFFDEAFAQFCAREDLPDFDSIGLHGIWSWISDENRNIVVDFLRRKLKVGGVLYVSYNTLPGWSAAMPLRHLLTSHANVMGAAGQGIVGRIDNALQFSEKLLEAKPGYLNANPTISDRLKRIKALDRHYLAHEYFNRDWHPMYFSDMAEWLAPAKVSFACSAHFMDHIDGVNLSADQQKIVNELPAGEFRETVRDYCTNQQFRRDYWVKGARQLSVLEQMEGMRRQRLVLIQPSAQVNLKVSGPQGEVSLKPDIYQAVLGVLASHEIKTFAQVEQAVAGQGFSFGHVREAVTVLLGQGVLQLGQDPDDASKVKAQCDRLNAHLMNLARSGGINFLASPVIGGAVGVTRTQQLYLLARRSGRKTPQEWAAFAWDAINGLGQKLVKDGKPLETAQENIDELDRQAQDFLMLRLPVLKALGIA